MAFDKLKSHLNVDMEDGVRDSGVLSDAEFEAEKAKVLGGG